jgi:sulfur carrier protein
MKVIINGQAAELPDGASVADAVQHLYAQQAGAGPYAVAVNLQFVPRAAHASTPLHEGDRIEIITPVTGG